MSHRSPCPHLPETLTAFRRGDPAAAVHVRRCGDCSDALALERGLTVLAAAEGRRASISAEAMRLEAALIIEERRLARCAMTRVALHALAFAVCALLVAAVAMLGLAHEALAGAMLAGAGLAATLSLWNLLRAVGDAAVAS
ncbi:MAG TPA: hypothetical protein VFV19_02925 [Candidatus Polarisedimenticolaceae bacterium]|nr:hypothetical protein [Candidatus Polarisedimenticolaceae bacterium]